jgi:DNA-binding response OmpR family regulator
LFRVLVVTDKVDVSEELRSCLDKSVFIVSRAFSRGKVFDTLSVGTWDVLFLDMRSGQEDDLRKISKEIKKTARLPILALVNQDTLINVRDNLDIDDFILEPYEQDQLLVRITLALRRSGKVVDDSLIGRGNLEIDPAGCEVKVAGRKIELTFREYELLKFLANYPGRVFTREALLNKVWGYDYYGGDRTVDVHIRRLRSKIGEADCVQIETVRNIGYRFREEKISG